MEFRRLLPWLALPSTAADEAALDSHLRQLVLLYGAGCALVLNLMHLLFWPLDPLLLEASPAVQQVMRWFRWTTFLNHSLLLASLGIPFLRRRPLPLIVLCMAVSSVLFGVSMARLGGLQSPYFYMTYLAPVGMAALPIRPLSRLWLSPACAALLCGSYFATRPAELDSPLLGSALGCMVFAVIVSIAIGQAMYLLARRAFLTELALKRLTAAQKEHGEQLESEVADHARQLQRLAAYLTRASEDERTRLSRELHDELGQQIVALRYMLAFVRKELQETPKHPAAALAEMEEMLGHLAAAVRYLVSDLRPRILDDLGLGAALEWLVARTRERTGLLCTLKLDLDPAIEIPPPQAGAVFRIVQESLTNVARHAGAARVEIAVAVADGAIRASVADDGRGMEPVALDRAGMGLFGMSERARAQGGRLEIKSSAGSGTTVRVELPLVTMEQT